MAVHRDDEWFIEAVGKLKTDLEFSTDTEIAEWLNCPRNLISQIRAGNSRPPFRLKMKVADHLGYLKTVDGLAWLISQGLGDEIGEKMKSAILGLVKK